MRISRLELRNYHAHQRTTTELGSSTVITGANDSGKSTLLSAVDWLFNWRRYELDEHPLHTHRYRGPDSADVMDVGVSVVVECEALGERRTAVFEPLLSEGRLRFARLARLGIPAFDQAAPWIVASPEAWCRLAEKAARDGDLRRSPPGMAAELALESYRLECLEIDGDWWMPAEAVVDVFWCHPAPDIEDLPRATDIVWLRGPEQELDATDLVRPIIRERLKQDLGDPDKRRRRSWLSQLQNPVEYLKRAEAGDRPPAETKADEVLEIADAAREAARVAWQTAASRVLGRDRQVEFPSDPYGHLELLIDAAVGRLAPYLDGYPIAEAGAGTRRALALAALDLYRDASLWPDGATIVVMIEEPEVGLDPASQRRVAAALRDLTGGSVQTIVVTHSAILVDATDATGLRIISRDQQADGRGPARLDIPYRLEEVAEALGTKPSDVLLARRFLVVEGPSDAGVVSMWAEELGINLRLAGTHIVDAGGYSATPTVAKLIEVAYRDVPVSVLLDNGVDTHKVKLELEAKYGDRVSVTLLPTTEIEGCFSVDAVEGWLDRKGVELSDEVHQDIVGRLDRGVRKAALQAIAKQYLSRRYDEVKDGMAIAAVMTEDRIPLPVKSAIFALVKGEQEPG